MITNKQEQTVNDSEQKIMLLGNLLLLEKRLREAETVAELGFIIVNETHRMIKFRQAILWLMGPTGRIRIHSVSGVDTPDRNSPFLIYLRGLFKHLLRKSDSRRVHVITENDLKERHRSGWQEWSLGTALWCPLINRQGEMLGGLFFPRETEWDKGDAAIFERLTDAFAHDIWSLMNQRRSWGSRLGTLWKEKRLRFLVIAMIVVLMWLHVRLSVLAPVEIVPLDPLIVSAPMEGVIKRFHVEPNQAIKNGTLLFSFDDTTIRNEYEVSRKALSVARADYMRATQKSFMDEKSRADLLLLKAQIEHKSAEVAYAAELLQRGNVHAEQDGIAVFGDVNDWLGKPVVVGEKVLTIADPARIEAEIRLLVEDAINLETGAQVLIFLNVEPDRPLSARLRKASYEAQATPEGTLVFRLKATITEKGRVPRIGLRGTAKIYGKRVSLFYYLMRRPLATLRQTLGM